jgi:hypothetical protein
MSLRQQMEAWAKAQPIQHGAISNSPGQTEGMGFPGGPFRTSGVGDTSGGGDPFMGGGPPGWGPPRGGWMPPSPGVFTPPGIVTGSAFADAGLNPASEGNRQCAQGDWKCLAAANSPGRNRFA